MRQLFTVNEFISAMTQRGFVPLSQTEYLTECSIRLTFGDQKGDCTSIECILAGSEPFFDSIIFRATLEFSGDFTNILQTWTSRPRLFNFELNELPKLHVSGSTAPNCLIEFMMHIDHPGEDLTLSVMCLLRIWTDAIDELCGILAQV